MKPVTAMLVKELPTSESGASQKLWKLSAPITYGWNEDRETMFVVTSKVASAWATETYAFPSDENGEVIDWGELSGSQEGVVSHEVVIEAVLNYHAMTS